MRNTYTNDTIATYLKYGMTKSANTPDNNRTWGEWFDSFNKPVQSKNTLQNAGENSLKVNNFINRNATPAVPPATPPARTWGGWLADGITSGAGKINKNLGQATKNFFDASSKFKTNIANKIKGVGPAAKVLGTASVAVGQALHAPEYLENMKARWNNSNSALGGLASCGAGLAWDVCKAEAQDGYEFGNLIGSYTTQPMAKALGGMYGRMMYGDPSKQVYPQQTSPEFDNNAMIAQNSYAGRAMQFPTF